MSKNTDSTNVNNFNNKLYSWLNKYVVPRLGDDKFYAAFGGSLRIIETLKKRGKFSCK